MSSLIFSRGANRTKTITSKDPLFIGTGLENDTFSITVDALPPLEQVRLGREIVRLREAPEYASGAEGDQDYNYRMNKMVWMRHVKKWEGFQMLVGGDTYAPLACDDAGKELVAESSPTLLSIVGTFIFRDPEPGLTSAGKSKKLADQTAALLNGAVLIEPRSDDETESADTGEMGNSPAPGSGAIP